MGFTAPLQVTSEESTGQKERLFWFRVEQVSGGL